MQLYKKIENHFHKQSEKACMYFLTRGVITRNLLAYLFEYVRIIFITPQMVFIDHSVMLLQCEKINTLILGLHLSLFCLVVLQSPRLLDTREAYVAAF